MSANEQMAYAVLRARGLPALEAYLFARHPDLKRVVRPDGTGLDRDGWYTCGGTPNYGAASGLRPPNRA